MGRIRHYVSIENPHKKKPENPVMAAPKVEEAAPVEETATEQPKKKAGVKNDRGTSKDA